MKVLNNAAEIKEARLLNLAKNELGRISKIILNKINVDLQTFLLEKIIEFSNKIKIGLYRCGSLSNFREKSGIN